MQLATFVAFVEISTSFALGAVPTSAAGIWASAIVSAAVEAQHAAASGTAVPSRTDPAAWCATQNFSDPDVALKVWEGWGIGQYLSIYLTDVNDGDANWPANLYNFSHPEAGDTDTEDCGVLGATCNPALDCVDMVNRGFPEVYYILDVLSRFQSQLNAASTLLNEAVTSDILNIPQLVSDFSAPKTFENAQGLAGIISSAFFLVGGAANLASLGLGSIAESQTETIGTDIGVIQGRIGELQGIAAQNSGTKLIAQELQDQQQLLDAAEQATTLTGGKVSSVLGGGIYLTGSALGEVSATILPNDQVDATALDEQVYAMFNSSVQRLTMIGSLAMGGPGNYSVLPHQNGISGPLQGNDPVAGFFSDGKFLYGSLDQSSLTAQVNAGFQLFALKLVDLAVQGGGFQVFAETNIERPSDCNMYGAQWIDSYCFRLFRYDSTEQSCQGIDGQLATSAGGTVCNWIAAANSDYDKIEKWGLNMTNYYTAAYNCATSGQSTYNVTAIPLETSLPTCWYNIRTQQADFTSQTVAGRALKQIVQLSSFPTQAPSPAAPGQFTGKCASGDLELAVYYDGNCEKAFQYTVCATYAQCQHITPGFSSMRIFSEQDLTPPGHPHGGTITAWGGPDCTQGSHGYGSTETGCLNQFNTGTLNDGANFTANSIELA